MPTHWTYVEVAADADLMQGDILVPTDALREIFTEVHPHFINSKYIGFLVTTQSCDLVRRGGACSTRYINIAVVRELDDVLHDFLSHVCKPVAAQVYLHEQKAEAHRLLQRLFNQNEQALGLFYLHKDADAGIAVPAVALLRVGVTLRSTHYDALVRAREGRLAPEFTAKLGWLVGNLYSRVGTPDWSEPKEREKELQTLIKDTLGSAAAEGTPVWVHRSWVDAAVQNGVKLDDLPSDQLHSELEKHKPATAKELVIESAKKVVKEVMSEATDDQLRKIANRLKNDQFLAKALKAAKSE